MSISGKAAHVNLVLGRFFFARGQNFPLQLATVEVAGPHKNT